MEAELPKLNNTFIANKYKSELLQVKEISALIQKASLNDINKNHTLEDIKHARLAVASRNFGIVLKNENKHYNVLAPYTDMFNFDPQWNTFWLDNLDDEKGFFLLKATEEIKKGKQIFVAYGADDNEKLLLDYGFTLENNPFKPYNVNFIYTHKGYDYYAILRMEETKNLIQIRELHRSKDNMKLNMDKDKEKIKNEDLAVFKSVLANLKTYSDKGRIQEYKKNEKKNPNYTNIYRALLTEDALIDVNVKFLEEIIEVLQGGKQKLQEKAQIYQAVIQNKKYFEDILV